MAAFPQGTEAHLKATTLHLLYNPIQIFQAWNREKHTSMLTELMGIEKPQKF